MTSPSPATGAAATAAATAATVAAPASQPQQPQHHKICFNAHCKEPKSDGPRRRGWRLRSGEFAELCDRCYGSFEQGSFCETFHSEVAGWRKCEACGKRLHCGCIVSVHAYVLLDAGGVDCIMCARKSHSLAPTQMWSSSMHMSQQLSDRKESYIKSWRPPAGPFPGHWRQGNLWSVSSVQSDLQQRLAFEFDRPSSSEKLLPGRTFIHAQDKKFDDMHERLTPSSMNQIIRERYANGHTGMDPPYSYTLYHREGGNPNGLHDTSHHAGENDPMSSRKGVISDPCAAISTGFNLDTHPNSHPSSILKDDPSSLPVGLTANFSTPNGPKDPVRIPSSQPQAQVASSSMPKQFYPQNVMDGEMQAQMRNGRPRMDAKARSQLLPRYWPRITDQELQQISGDSNSVITPLFEKMLSASDAGRIGRLVLPKKCAEAYFPAISQPEGLPLKVQDASGKEWVFQFRFWPNNNSRMYVLEGVTPCIQSMQLQAGDTVTFSRIDPEGKLVMGFRKASNLSSEQDQAVKSANGFSTPPEGNNKVLAPDSSPTATCRQNKVNAELKSSPSPVEQATAGTKFDRGFAQKDGPAVRPSQGPIKRKATSVGLKNKRLRMENEDSIELKITWEEAQELLRPPPDKIPSIVVVDGHEFEEYEEPPVLGRRTYLVTDQTGDSHQWAQCEDCSKWRKLPVDVLLPSKWTCCDNKWDPERSSCTCAQELNMEQLAELIPTKPGPAKRSKVKVETDTIEASDGLDTLANLAILGEGEALPSQPTTKHPRHRPGCTCIVCIQPPSGKGPKHKQTCTCNVCLTVRRRFRTLMLRREKRQSEKEAETARKQNQQVQQSTELPPQGMNGPPPPSAGTSGGSPQKAGTNAEPEEAVIEHKIISSPLKTQIDLNIQPEREDEQSPKSDTGGMMRLLRDAPT